MSEKPWCRRLSVGAGRAEASLGKSQSMKRHSVSIHGQSEVSSCTRPGLKAGEVEVQCRERRERGLSAGSWHYLSLLHLVRYRLLVLPVGRKVLSVRFKDGRSTSVVGPAEQESSRS